MLFLNKYYNADMADGGGAVDVVLDDDSAKTEVVEQESVAAILAKNGKKTDFVDESPIDKILEQKTDVLDDLEAAKADVKLPESKSESSNKEAQPTAEKKTTPQAEQVSLETTVNWVDLVKKQPKEEVLKEIGFNEQTAEFVKDLSEIDPKVWGLVNAYKEGKAVEYLKEVSKNYEEMASEDIMRSNIERENPFASDEEIDALYERDVFEKYSLDSDDEDVLKKGNLLLNADAKRFRAKFKAEHDEKYTLPEFVPKQKEDVSESVVANKQATDKLVQEARDTHTANPTIKNILEKNVITVGEGIEAFNFTVDGNEIADISLNGAESLLADIEYGSDGEITSYKPKSEHRALVATVAKYGLDYMSAFAKHHQGIGAKNAIEKIDSVEIKNNVSAVSSQVTDDANLSPAALLAKKGTRSDS